MNLASNISVFKKDAGTKSPAPSWMGSRPTTFGRNDGGFKMARSATVRTQTNFAGSTNFAPINEDEAAKSFAAAVIDFDAATLARAARRHVETAKLWKAGKRCPNTSSTINMASIIPAVQGWLDGEVESRKPRAPADSRAATAAYARLQQEAMQPGERGAMARAILADLSGGF